MSITRRVTGALGAFGSVGAVVLALLIHDEGWGEFAAVFAPVFLVPLIGQLGDHGRATIARLIRLSGYLGALAFAIAIVSIVIAERGHQPPVEGARLAIMLMMTGIWMAGANLLGGLRKTLPAPIASLGVIAGSAWSLMLSSAALYDLAPATAGGLTTLWGLVVVLFAVAFPFWSLLLGIWLLAGATPMAPPRDEPARVLAAN